MVNRRGYAGYDVGLQKHHVLPRQLLGMACFIRLFDAIGRARIGFDDFRANGLLLPAREKAAHRLGLPLHRGPHRDYNRLVIERVGQIESGYARTCGSLPHSAHVDAAFRLALLQRGLKSRLLRPRRQAFRLNRRDPLGTGFDFAELDAMAETLWLETQPEILASNDSFAD